MPLQGNLRDVSTTQLLRLINLSKKTGTLVLYQAVRTGEMEQVTAEQEREEIKAGDKRAAISFKGGKLIFATFSGKDSGLVAVLNKAGKISNEQAKLIRDRASGASDKAIALRLIGAKYVTQNDVVSSIRQHIVDLLFDMMGWQEEPFRFEDDALPGGNHIMVPIDVEPIIVQWTREQDKDQVFNDTIPDLNWSLRVPPDAKEKYKRSHLNVEEWRVVSFVHPKNSIKQIAKANNMTDFEIRRVVYGLIHAGLVELVRPARAEKPGAKSKQPKVQKETVSKLISKLKSM